MARELHLRAQGLHTDPNQYALPEGALRTAENVVIRREGVVEPRPGFKDATDAGLTATEVERVLPYDGSYVLACRTDAGAWSYRQKDGTEITDEDGATIAFDSPERIDVDDMHGDLFVTTASGVRRISDATDTTAHLAGAPDALNGQVNMLDTSADTWLADGDSVGYRVVVARTVGDRVIRSAPSGRFFAENGTGFAAHVEMAIRRPSDFDSNTDLVEIYRSKAVTGTPEDTEDTMFFVGTTTGTSFADYVAESDLGAALYTNATREGILQANHRPPKAATVSTYHGMMMYGRTKRRHTVALQAYLGAATNKASWQRYKLTGDVSSGSDTITNFSMVDGAREQLAVGQYLTDVNVASSGSPDDNGTYIAGKSKITAVDTAASTITLDKNALSDGTTVTLYAHDAVTVDGEAVYAHSSDTLTDPPDHLAPGGTPSGSNASSWESVEGIATVINEPSSAIRTNASIYAIPTYIQPDLVGLIVYRVHFDDGQFSWDSSAFEDPEGRTTSDNQDSPARLYYSKSDQPDHVPATNFFEVGRPGSALLRCIVIRGSLLAFKTDGVYRITGRTPEALRVDPLDTDCILVHPQCVDVLDNRAIAWTNRGVVAVSDVGVTPLSDPVIEDDLSEPQDHFLSQIRTTSSDPDLSALFLVAHYGRNEFYLSVPRDQEFTYDYTQVLYVFNTKTGAWTTWTPPVDRNTNSEEPTTTFYDMWRSMAVEPTSGDLLVGGNDKNDGTFPTNSDTPKVWQERTGLGVVIGGTTFYGNAADQEYSITIDSVSSDDITISSGSGWVPEVGDVVVDGSNIAIVTAVTANNSTDFTVNDGSLLSTGSATAYEGYPCSVEWVAKTARDPMLDKYWKESVFLLRQYDARTATLSFTSNINETADELTDTYDAFGTLQDREIRCLVPTDHGRVPILRPKVTITQALARWQLSGLALTYDPMSGRVHAP